MKFATRSTSNKTMDIEPIVIRETKITRLIFSPAWVQESDNPLRGGFRFQRKGPNEQWSDFDSKPLSTLHKDEEYHLNLEGNEISLLLNSLEEINSTLKQHGHVNGRRVFINEENAESILLQIGEIDNRELVVDQLRKLENEKFENLGSVIGRAKLEKVIAIYNENINNGSENFWQEFFENHPWMLQQVFAFPVVCLNGETYLGGKNSRGRQGSGGTATDFLFKNGSNGSFAVIEIKTPNCELVGARYRGEEGSGEGNEIYRMHGDLTGGIVQMENQICIAIEHFKTTIGSDYGDLNHLNPTGVLIAGNYSTLDAAQKKSFDLFRKSLGKNQIYTFDEVLAKLELLKGIYEH